MDRVVSLMGTDKRGLVDWLAIAHFWSELGATSYVVDRLVVDLHTKGDYCGRHCDSDMVPKLTEAEKADAEKTEPCSDPEDESELYSALTQACICELQNGLIDTNELSGDLLMFVDRKQFVELARSRVQKTADLGCKIDIADDGQITIDGMSSSEFLMASDHMPEYDWLGRLEDYAI